jgi:hypothetical protein
MLREPAPPEAADFDAAMRETLPGPIDLQDDSAHILDNSVREFSLFDAQDESDEISTPPRPQRAQQEQRNRGAAPRPSTRRVRLVRAAARALRSVASRLQHRSS